MGFPIQFALLFPFCHPSCIAQCVIKIIQKEKSYIKRKRGIKVSLKRQIWVYIANALFLGLRT